VGVIVGFFYNLFAVFKRLVPARVTEFFVAGVFGLNRKKKRLQIQVLVLPVSTAGKFLLTA
jgi:hypothetical protein